MRLASGVLTAVLFVTGFPIAAAQPAPQSPAQAPPEALSSVYQCASIQDDTARLTCYDTAVRRLHEADASGQFVAVDRQRVQTLQRESFGFHLPSIGRLLPNFGGSGGGVPERIQAAVTSLGMHRDGRHTFTLENGQVWAEVEPGDSRNVHVGDTATIRQMSMGSFMLSSSRGGAGHRVQREQ